MRVRARVMGEGESVGENFSRKEVGGLCRSTALVS